MTFLSNEAIRCAKCMAKTITRSLANCPTAPLCCSGTALVAISSRQYPSSNLFSCLLKPLRGIVRRASCHVLGKVCRVPDHERDQQTQCTVRSGRISSTGMPSAAAADLRRSLLTVRPKASKKCSRPIGAMEAAISGSKYREVNASTSQQRPSGDLCGHKR